MSTRRSCAICAIRDQALCGALAREQLPRLNRRACQKHYQAGQFIAAAGQRQDWFATVLSGVVKLTRTMCDGRQQIVGLLFPSDFLGRPFGSSTPFGAEAATAVELCCVERPYFEELLLKTPQMQRLFLERTLDEVDAAREWMLVLGRKTAEERVASLILLMAQRAGRHNGDTQQASAVRYDLPLSRTEMAEYLGLRIETISRQLGRLRAAGAIDTDSGRMLTVCDMAKLERMAGREPG
jgi:CRP/FNR family transcriptional regulator, anaerobic regulatory protein